MSRSANTVKTLVLGLGNLLLADEGVGVHAARALIRKGVAEGVTVVDAGTAILDTLPYLEEADRVIVVDAFKGDSAPGTVYRLGFEECARKECIASMHGFDIACVLAMAQRKDVPQITVIGVEPKRIEFSLELSAEVAASLAAVVRAVEEEAAH